MSSKNKPKLNFTGERMLNHPDSDLFKISFERYLFASKFISPDSTVLDIACGSGYGSKHLSSSAYTVLGIDVDKKTIQYCQQQHHSPNLTFKAGDAKDYIPELKNKFDFVVSFETLEHLPDPQKFLSILSSYLKHKGTLILSTPNNYHHIHPPKNKFHCREFYILETLELLQRAFPKSSISVFGQIKSGLISGNSAPKINIFRTVLSSIFAFIYMIDSRYLHLLRHFEHLPIYKKIGGLQRDFSLNPEIYPIDLNSNFIEPQISIFVVSAND